MTRNDFEILARHLRAMHPGKAASYVGKYDRGYIDGYNAAIDQIVGACSSVNARFNKERFLAASTKGE